MIKAKVSEVKNRLSYYLRLVKGGEEVEIVDRKTPLARIISIRDVSQPGKEANWIKELCDLGMVNPPNLKKVPTDILSKEQVIICEGGTCGVLDALLEERNTGR